MDKEQIEALKAVGTQATIVFMSALKESGSTETAKAVTELFLRTLLKPDTPKFLL